MQAEHDVSALCGEVETVLTSLGAETALNWLSPQRSSSADRAKVVVLGEVGTGKTSLINAVVGRPGLLPQTPTSTYVGVGAGSSDLLRVHLRDGNIIDGQLVDISRWMDRACGADAEVAHIEVLLAEPSLTQMTLFDTPGAGAGGSPAEVSPLDALAEATALVFVCSAEAKISLAERAFLRDAAARIEHIVFVLSKVDLLDDLGEQNLHENRETVRDDRRFPPDRFPRLSFLPFSAALADAGARGDQHALQDSGVVALRERLQDIAAQHWHLNQLNELRAIRSALSTGFQVLAERKQFLQTPGDASRELVVTRRNELRERSRTWRSQLSRDIDSACDDVLHQLRARMRRLRHTYEERVGKGGRAEIRSVETDLVEDLCAVQAEILATVTERVTETAVRLFAQAGAHAPVDDLVAQRPDTVENPADYLGDRPRAAARASAGLMDMSTLYIGAMMAKNLHLGPAAPIGVAWALLQRYARHRAADQAELKAWVQTSITDASGEITALVTRTFKRANTFLPDAVEAAFNAALADVDKQKKALDADASVITDESARIERLGSRLVELRQRCDQQQRALAALPAASARSQGHDQNPAPTQTHQ